MDFEELLLRPLKMMNESPELKEKIQNRFDYIMVDEFQDTNSTQMKLVDLLSQSHGNLAVVGDDDQAFAVLIEPTDREEALLRGDQVDHALATIGVLRCLQILAGSDQLLAFGHDFCRAAHHLNVKRGRILR